MFGLKILSFLIAAYLAILVLFYVFQRKLMYFPDNTQFERCSNMVSLGAKPITSSRAEMRLRYYSREVPEAKGMVIITHGNGGSACSRFWILKGLRDLGLNFYFIEYPGYANDPEHPTQDRILKNSDAIVEEIKEQNPELPIVFFGESIGTGPATYLAMKHSPHGLILSTPYTSIGETGQRHFPFIPARILVKDNFEAYEWARSVKCPVFVIHGTEDRTIPYDIGKKQAENFRSVEMLTIEGAGHSNLAGDHRYWVGLKAFLSKNLQ